MLRRLIAVDAIAFCESSPPQLHELFVGEISVKAETRSDRGCLVE